MNERSIFLAALEIPDPAERAAYLEVACAGDPAVWRGVEDLLAAHARPGSFMPAPVGGQATRAHVPGEGPGSRVGPYKLLQQIGEGGMGIVYMAEQEEPVRRKVALKIIKPGMDSRQVISRFEAERQALSMMDHPNIARVLDAGATDSGRPYFVMELVHGVPITAFCDEARLSPRERLGLFVPVCQAIQHAHQKGIIHRDVKPSNVLVTMYDDKPVPKVIDFGVAKAVEQRLTEKTLFTQFGAMVGTLEYMSPEQAEMNAFGVDTRSDIYSLGVLLYELLTGTTPLERQRLREAVLGEVVRLIKEEEPPRPSLRLSTSGTLAKVAAARKTDPAKLAALVRGELDWIVMRCLEKDRTRRYDTANGLARDVERYLKDEPVEACPPSARYRLRKLLRRHKGPVLVAGLLVFALSAGVVGTTVGLVEARRQRDAAESSRTNEAQARREALAQKAQAEASGGRATAAERQAREEAATARAVRDFLQDDLLLQASFFNQAAALWQADGEFQVKRNPTVNELLDRAAAGLTPDKIRARFPDLPLVQAEVLKTVGEAYSGISEGAKAVDLLTRAVELYRSVGRPDDPAMLAARHALGVAYLGAGKHAEGVALLEAVRDDRTRILGPSHRDTFATRTELGLAYMSARGPATAVAFFERLRDDARTHLGPDDRQTQGATHHLATALLRSGRPADAIREYVALRDASRRLNIRPDHPFELYRASSLASAYQAAGQPDKAIALFEQAASGWAASLGPSDPTTLSAMRQLGLAYLQAGRFVEAIAAFEKHLAALPLTTPALDRAAVLSSHADAFHLVGRNAEVLALREKVRDIRQANLPQDHPHVLRAIQYLASTYALVGRGEESIVMLEDVIRRCRAANGPNHPETLMAMMSLCHIFSAAGRPAEAAEVAAKVVAVRRQLDDPNALMLSELSEDLGSLGRNLIDAGRAAEAEPVLREGLDLKSRAQPTVWRTAVYKAWLGEALLGQEKHPEAEPYLLAGYKEMTERHTAMPAWDAQEFPRATANLVTLYTALGRPEDVKKWQTERAKYDKPAPKLEGE